MLFSFLFIVILFAYSSRCFVLFTFHTIHFNIIWFMTSSHFSEQTNQMINENQIKINTYWLDRKQFSEIAKWAIWYFDLKNHIDRVIQTRIINKWQHLDEFKQKIDKKEILYDDEE
jgi:hypothetical protein